MLRKFFVLALLSVAFSGAMAAEKVAITITNPIAADRNEEIVEVNAETVKAQLMKGRDAKDADLQFVVTDAEGKELPSQLTYDGKLIFQTTVAGKQKGTYYVTLGTQQKYEAKVMGRLFTERGDEFGWENDRVAYRIYGHGAAVGYDLFNKKTHKLMLNWWYASEQDQEMRSVSKKLHDRGYHDLADQVYNAFCYHIDHGEGMDCYTVGPTLGGGANALMSSDGKMTLPKCYKAYEILDNGPLRFTVKLTYPEVTFKGRKITETRIVTLDAGTHFNKVVVSYDGLENEVEMVSGVVIHEQNPDAYVMNCGEGYLGYEDFGDGSPYNKNYRKELEKQMGRIYVGTVYAKNPSDMSFVPGKNGIATGHVMAKDKVKSGVGYAYWFGSAWDKHEAEGITSLKDWENALLQQAKRVRKPLLVKISK